MKTFTKTKLIPETEEDVLSLRAGDVVHFYTPKADRLKMKLNDNPKINEITPQRYTAWFEFNGDIEFDLSDIEKVIRWEER
ncbi:MAG: hypothetical protein V4629_03340 [Pseudomonadota bacterium]